MKGNKIRLYDRELGIAFAKVKFFDYRNRDPYVSQSQIVVTYPINFRSLIFLLILSRLLLH